MVRKTKRAALVLTTEHRTMLTELAGSRTAPIREVEMVAHDLDQARQHALLKSQGFKVCVGRE